MSHNPDEREPRISLGVAHVQQDLQQIVENLEEPITITVRGTPRAVLVPYAVYWQMLAELEREEEEVGPEPEE